MFFFFVQNESAFYLIKIRFFLDRRIFVGRAKNKSERKQERMELHGITKGFANMVIIFNLKLITELSCIYKKFYC